MLPLSWVISIGYFSLIIYLKKPTYIINFSIIITALFGILSCESSDNKMQQGVEVPIVDSITLAGMTGAELSKIYCGSCHLFPNPDRLDHHTWEQRVLPEMAHRLGIKDRRTDPFKGLSMEEAYFVSKTQAYPEHPLIDTVSWQKIVEYYTQNAADSLPPQTSKPSIDTSSFPFRVTALQPDIFGDPLTTNVRMDTISQQLFVGNATNQALFYHHRDGFSSSFQTFSPVVDIHLDQKGGAFLLLIGIIFPTDQKTGQLVYRDSSGQTSVCIEKLPRPVHASFSDLNQDGLEDVVICGYGNYTGRLSWWENKDSCQYEEHLILDQPGPLKTIIIDFNQDGLPDILSLFGQGREGIYIHYNQGKKGFKTEPILQFDPVMGSAYFELVDFENDGDLDILYASGDNADYSYSLKPYHGIRIFTNNGNNQFEERFFYPMYGAFKAQACDFDLDGDLDIAAISFFPDYEGVQPESFVYLENQASNDRVFPSFLAKSFPDANRGRWLVMDTGDLNADGFIDIFLGSFIYSGTPVSPTYKNRWSKEGIHGMILWNQGKRE